MLASVADMREIAVNTLELTLQPKETFSFTAGQYCKLRLPGLAPSIDKPTRKFTLVNAPHEEGKIVIATRAGVTPYKQQMRSLSSGDEVEIEKIKGKLTLPKVIDRPLVFIAGGIGVAPFVSMLRYLKQNSQDIPLTMLYFNRTEKDAAYLAELTQLAAESAHFTLHLIMTRDQAWQGEKSRLTPQLISCLLGDPRTYTFYVVGTPALVSTALQMLNQADVERRHIHDESFTGYGVKG